METASKKIVRPPIVAGSFYERIPGALKDSIQDLLNKAEVKNTYAHIYGIVSPHAGYVYSGLTAAHAYKTLIGKSYKRVIILSPSHREFFNGVSLLKGDSYQTPLGELDIDKDFAKLLIGEHSPIFESLQGHRLEHALEVQLPFLQIVLSDFKIIPLVIGNQSRSIINSLANTLSKVIDRDTLLVASSDLSHFHSKLDAKKLDDSVATSIKKYDSENLQYELENNNLEACGGGCIITIMETLSAFKNIKCDILHRSDSSDFSGDTSEVVGYLSAVFYS